MTNLKNLRVFNANTIKFLAAFCMVIDHVGLMFFPYQLWFRAVGRLSMPLFAFAISEGCRYTRNKIKHFAMLFGLGAICQLVFYIYSGDTYFNILLTFSLSVLNIYALQHLKKCIFENKKWNKLVPAMLIFLFCVAGTAFVCHIPQITIDYGFWGCMMPVFASLFDFRGIETATPPPRKVAKIRLFARTRFMHGRRHFDVVSYQAFHRLHHLLRAVCHPHLIVV